MRHVLLISNSTQHGSGYLEHCADEIREFLKGCRTVLFVPYALHDHDAYAAAARTAYDAMGFELESIHTFPDPCAAVANSDAIFIGGGNTFRLLKTLQDQQLISVIRENVAAGTPYIGTSAGSNIACRSIQTTNDMPIVQPHSFEALALVSFNLNPHYLDPDPSSTHMGETRETRITEFHEENDAAVLGLREGGLLQIDGDTMTLKGRRDLRLFERGEAPREFPPGSDLSQLL